MINVIKLIIKCGTICLTNTHVFLTKKVVGRSPSRGVWFLAISSSGTLHGPSHFTHVRGVLHHQCHGDQFRQSTNHANHFKSIDIPSPVGCKVSFVTFMLPYATFGLLASILIQTTSRFCFQVPNMPRSPGSYWTFCTITWLQVSLGV